MEKDQAGGALAIGVADRIIMLENAVYSILSPEGFASILYKDSSKNKEAAEAMKMTAKDLKQMNLIDEIIKEPKSGIEEHCELVANSMKKEIEKMLKELSKLSVEELLEKRYQKFRKIGN